MSRYPPAYIMTMVALNSWLRENRPLLVLLVFAALLRAAYLWIYAGMPEWDQLTVDNNYHHHWAQSIASGNLLGDTTYFRAPFYTICLGLLYAVMGTSLWVGRLLGAAIGVASVGLTYLLGKRAVSSRTGLVAATLHALWPWALYFESELLLDPMFTLLLQIAAYRLLVWLDHRTRWGALSIGLVLGLAAITRPTALVVAIPMAIAFFVWRRVGQKWVGHLALFAAGLGLVILPVLARNLVVAADPVLISSQGGINFYIGNNPQADGLSAVLPEPMGHNWRLRQIEFEAEQTVGRNLKPGEISSYWAKKGWDWIAANPVDFAGLYLGKLYRNFAHREISNNRDLGHFANRHLMLKYNPLGFALLLALAVLGLVAGWRSISTKVFLWLILTYTVAGALFFFTSRFRLPLLPFYYVLAASGLANLLQATRSSWSAWSRRGLLVVAIAFLSYLPLVPLPVGLAPQATVSAGLYQYALGNYAAARDLQREAIHINSTFPEVNLNLGVTFVRLGRLDSARYYFEREKRLHPDRPKAFANLGSISLVEGNLGDATAMARQAIKRQPFDVTSQTLLLRCLLSDSTVDDAACIKAVHEAVEATENDIYLLNEAAVLLTERGQVDDARLILRQALEATPPAIETDDEAFATVFRNSIENVRLQRAQALYQLGFIEGQSGNLGQSVFYSSLAIELDSTLAEAYVNLISAYLSQGQTAQADSVLTAARRRFPDNPYLKRFR